jgi:ABC-2 type transport system permease protein
MTTTLDRAAHVREAPPSEPSRPLAGTWQLLRLALRRDRITLPIWLLVLGLMPAAGAKAYDSLYPTIAERGALTGAMRGNASVSLLYGPPFDLSTAGGWTAWRYGTLLPLFLALVCVFTVTRHTRQEEDTGRQELLSSAVVGRYAPLTAAVLVSALTSVVIGLLNAGSLTGAGLDAKGSLAFGVSLALSGCVYTGVVAIAVQLAEYARTANGIGTAFIGVTFLFRAVGDSATDASWLSWLSPIGWATQTRPFAGERWWALGLPVAATVLFIAAGYALLPRRDVGMGLVPARPGPRAAASWLRSSWALAWRLQRGALIGWTIGFAVMGALFGSLAAGVGDLVGTSEQTRQIVERMGGASGLVDAFLSAMAGMLGMIASLYAVQATLRLRSEEVAFRAEPLLATRVRRLAWAASHLVFALVGSAVLLAASGVATGLLHGARVHDLSGQLPRVFEVTMAQLPAVWVVTGAAVLLFGFVPKLSTVAWGVATVFLAVSLFGPMLQLSDAVMDISPFQHVPKLSHDGVAMAPLLWLTGIAVVAVGAGLTGFRRRDIG